MTTFTGASEARHSQLSAPLNQNMGVFNGGLAPLTGSLAPDSGRVRTSVAAVHVQLSRNTDTDRGRFSASATLARHRYKRAILRASRRMRTPPPSVLLLVRPLFHAGHSITVTPMASEAKDSQRVTAPMPPTWV